MFRKVCLVVMCLMLTASLAYAAVGVQEDSGQIWAATDINFTGDVTVTNSGSVSSIAIDDSSSITNEVVTATADTVTAADSPTRYIATAGATTTFTLPAAAADLEFIFCDATDTTITIDTYDATDTIMYLTLDAGDTIDSAGAAGDSVHLVGGTNVWYVVDTGSSAWTDGDAS